MTLPTRFSGSGAPAISAAYEGATYQQEDTNNGNVYVARAGAWVALARIGSTVTFSALTLSGLGLGIAHVSAGGVFSSSLIVNADIAPGAAIAVSKLAVGAANTVLWSDGATNSFTGSPILSTSLQVQTGATKTVISNTIGLAALFFGNVTPGATTYSLIGDGTTFLGMNSPGTANSSLAFAIATHQVGSITDSTTLTGVKGFSFIYDAAYTVGQWTQQSNVATFDLTIKSQQPFASATGTNRNPGNLVLAIPAPTAGGAEGYVKTNITASVRTAIGNNAYPAGQGGDIGGAIWLGVTNAGTPSTTNWTIDSNGTNIVRLNSPHPTQGGTSFMMAGTFVATMARIGLFFDELSAFRISQNSPSSDLPTFALTIRSQAPFASATGTNRNSGSLIHDVPAPVSGGASGTHQFQFATATAFSFDSTTQWSLFGRTWTTGAGAPGGTPLEGALYTRTGAGVGDLLVGVNGAWVSTTVGGSGGFVPTSLTLTAGAGLTGGGDLSAPRTFDVVAGDATITVEANDIRVGTIQTTNIVLGGANQVLWSNGTVNSWTGAPILSTSLTIGALPASAGAIRLSNALAIQARNAANSIDITLIATDSINRIVIGTAASGVRVPIFTQGIVHSDSIGVLSTSLIVDADVSSITVAKLTGGIDGQVLQTVTATPTWVTYSGDVTGRPAVSTVIQLTGLTSNVSVVASSLTWVTGVNPLLTQTQAGSGDGANFTLSAQWGSGSGNTNGGHAWVFGGIGHGSGAHGHVMLFAGGSVVIDASTTEVQLSKSLLFAAAFSSPQIGHHQASSGSGTDTFYFSQSAAIGSGGNGGNQRFTAGAKDGAGADGMQIFQLGATVEMTISTHGVRIGDSSPNSNGLYDLEVVRSIAIGHGSAGAVFGRGPRSGSGAGFQTQFLGQDASGVNNDGGRSYFGGGRATGIGVPGSASLIDGVGGIFIEAAALDPDTRWVCALAGGGNVTSTQMPIGTGDHVIFIWNCGSPPSAAHPVGGGILFNDSGALKWMGPSGAITTMGAA